MIQLKKRHKHLSFHICNCCGHSQLCIEPGNTYLSPTRQYILNLQTSHSRIPTIKFSIIATLSTEVTHIKQKTCISATSCTTTMVTYQCIISPNSNFFLDPIQNAHQKEVEEGKPAEKHPQRKFESFINWRLNPLFECMSARELPVLLQSTLVWIFCVRVLPLLLVLLSELLTWLETL